MIVLNFHRIESPTGLEITRLSPARFRRVLDLVTQTGRVVGRARRDPLQVMPEVLFTFDDACASIGNEALPALRERGWNAIIFVISGAMGGSDDWDVRLLGRRRPVLTWEQARGWAEAGFTIGSHTCRHRDLTVLSPRALRAELHDSRAEIEDRCGAPVRQLAYPFGRHNERVRDAAREAGYDAAFAVNGPAGDRYAIPRVNVHTLMTMRELRRILISDAAPSWRTRLFASLSAGSATVGNWRCRRMAGAQI